MSFTNSEESSHIDKETIDENCLVTTDLNNLSTSDIQQLSDDISVQMESTSITEADMANVEDNDEELLQTEIVEIESELPDQQGDGQSKTAVPPLRPLNIAPKPTKVPISLKNLTLGQQLLLVQGGNGQPLKLLSTQGQGFKLANLGLNKPTTKNATKPFTPKQVIMKKVIAQVPKSALTKAMYDGKSQIVVLQQSSQKSSDQQIKIVQPSQIATVSSATNCSTSSISGLTTTTKTLTLAQAQQMGLIGPSTAAAVSNAASGKIITSMPVTAISADGTTLLSAVGSKQILLNNKTSSGNTKQLKILHQQRGPTKILPAPNVASAVAVSTGSTSLKLGTQRVIFKTANTTTGSVTSSPTTSLSTISGGSPTVAIANTQLLQTGTSSTGTSIQPGQIHQINVPGKGVQLIKFISAPTQIETGSNIATIQTIPIKTSLAASGSKLIPLQSLKSGIVLSEVKNLNKATGLTTSKMLKSASASTLRTVSLTSDVGTTAATSTTTLQLAQPQQVQLATTSSNGTTQQVLLLQPSFVQRGVSTGQAVQLQMRPLNKVPIPALTRSSSSHNQTGSSVLIANAANNSNTLTLTKTTTTGVNTDSSDTDLITSNQSTQSQHQQTPDMSMEANGLRPRKPCNCTKSQCLKLYCDCFANGEFCYLCNCMNCYNNLDFEDHRQRAIKNCLERNPHAFRPKIGKTKDSGSYNDGSLIRKHTKGCNCKRSGCLKNYCECYEAKIACSTNCKCIGCRNIEDLIEKKTQRQTVFDTKFVSSSPIEGRKKHHPFTENISLIRTKKPSSPVKHPFNYITSAVIDATSQCLLTLAQNADEFEQDDELTKRQIVEEFSRCLKQIIDFSVNKNHTAREI